MAFPEDVQALLRIRSVCQWEDGGTPYGRGVAESLRYVLSLCRDFGFRVKNAEDRYGYAEIGEGEELIGILVHLDTVPKGSGWSHEYGEIADGNLYGRGAIDDKGPAMAVIYAMKDILESGITLQKRIRIIFGLTEETGDWRDLELYKEREEMPSFGFTPDGYFPCVYGEKGILQLELIYPDSTGIRSISGGSAVNMVPDLCRAELATETGTICIEAAGVSAHGSTPEKGENAIANLLSHCDPTIPFVKFFNELFGHDVFGKQCGCACSDAPSGSLTLNVGKVSSDSEGIHLLLDIRYPVTANWEGIQDTLFRHAQGRVIAHLEPVYLDRNGRVVETLLNVYRQETGDYTEPMVIGGGTYARSMKNMVAFGPMFPHREEVEHKANEHIPLEDLHALRRIYKNTLLALMGETI